MLHPATGDRTEKQDLVFAQRDNADGLLLAPHTQGEQDMHQLWYKDCS